MRKTIARYSYLVDGVDFESDSIESIRYDRREHRLEVKMKRGAYQHLQYTRVPHQVWDSFVEADSKGRFYNANIRDQYPWEYR